MCFKSFFLKKNNLYFYTCINHEYLMRCEVLKSDEICSFWCPDLITFATQMFAQRLMMSTAAAGGGDQSASLEEDDLE